VCADPPFSIGASTSAFQIEGGRAERGDTIWDDYLQKNQWIGSGDVACDSYHRYGEDVQIMSDFGIRHYRFSISWSRIFPYGNTSSINREGVDYYHGVIDSLLLHGIQPVVTLFHWDLPSALQDGYGGWESPEIIRDFVLYADFVFAEYGSKVRHWITINEPYTFVMMGYVQGTFAPGKILDCDSEVPYRVAHHQILAHRSVYDLFHRYHANGRVGISLNSDYAYSESWETTDRALLFRLGWFLDPLVYGDYPGEMRGKVGWRLPIWEEENVVVDANRTVSTRGRGRSFDFLGINHYSTFHAVDGWNSQNCVSSDHEIGYVSMPGETIRANNGWLIYYPDGMRLLLEWIRDRYNGTTHIPQLMITENGWSTREGEIEDDERITYLRDYIASAAVLKEDLNITHYFIWSLMDNFEWRSGYNEKYGLFYVNATTLDRIPKKSAYWLRDMITPHRPKNRS
jgi:beta-glucosidase